MAFVKEELDETLANLQLKQSESKVRQARIKQYVGQQMSELVNEPRWTTYDQHLNALKERHSSELNQINAKLGASIYLTPNEFTELRYNQVKHKTAFEVLEQAQMLVRHLIADGKSAEESLS